jgi:hypothetical protein
MKRATTVVSGALLLALVAALPSCSEDGPGAGEARLEVDGTAIVTSDGDQEEVTGGRTVSFGDRVEITGGTAHLEMPGALRLELRAATGDADNTVLTVEEAPVLESGDVLAQAEGKAAVEAAGTKVTLEDAGAQVSRFLGMSVATYEGSVTLDSAGQVRTVPALRQMQVSTLGRPPQSVRPLEYDGGDPWDRRFLGASIDLGERLQRLADSYTSSLRRGEGRTVGFYQLVLPALDDEPAFTAELLGTGRPPGEILVGAAITSLGVRDTFATRWDKVFRFRDEGAAWGLVALDQGVSGSPLLGSVEQALGASPFEFAQQSGPRTTTPTTAPSTGPGPTTTTTSPTSPPTTEPPPPEPPPEEPGVLDPVLQPVGDLLDGLLGGDGDP